jgi:hypothetical protein
VRVVTRLTFALVLDSKKGFFTIRVCFGGSVSTQTFLLVNPDSEIHSKPDDLEELDLDELSESEELLSEMVTICIIASLPVDSVTLSLVIVDSDATVDAGVAARVEVPES